MTKRHSHRLAVRLSRIDVERLERGEISGSAQAIREALTRGVADSAGREHRPRGSFSSGEVQARDANEQRLLENLPPHFGKL